MRCRDCGAEFGAFDPLIPVWQIRLNRQGVEQAGYVHLWHLMNPEPES